MWSLDDVVSKRTDLQYTESGFSLLELVIAVSIMLVLGTVGTISYQAYTDNARTAAAESSASEVLTSVLAADDAPNQDPADAIRDYNTSSYGMMANIVTATPSEMVIETADKDGNMGYATINGNYSHIETTNYTAPGVAYQWVGAPHRSHSIKMVDGEEVSRNLIESPRINGGRWSAIHNASSFGGWEDGYGVELIRSAETIDEPFRSGVRTNTDTYRSAEEITVSFDAKRVVPGGKVRVMLHNMDTTDIVMGTVDVTDERERYVVHLDDNDPYRLYSDTFEWNSVYLDYLHNEPLDVGDTFGFFDKVVVEVGHTDGTYYDGDSL